MTLLAEVLRSDCDKSRRLRALSGSNRNAGESSSLVFYEVVVCL